MKRLIITESERKKILNMHGLKKMLSESTIVDVQNLLNTKFSAGLKPDGKYGPLTMLAIEKALSGGGQEPIKPIKPIDLTTNPLEIKPTGELTNPVTTAGTPEAAAAAGTTAGEPAADKGEDSSVPA